MPEDNMQHRINKIKEDYRLALDKRTRVPGDVVETYGYPRNIECIDDRIILLFRNVYTKINYVISSDPQFKELNILRQGAEVFNFYYERASGTLYIIEVNVVDILSGKAEASLTDKKNRILACSIDGTIQDVVISGEEQPCFPINLSFAPDNRLVFHDLANKQIRVMERDGKIVRRIHTGDKCSYFHHLRVSEGGEIYFMSLADKSWWPISLPENKDTLYRVDTDDKITAVYQSSYHDPAGSRFMDFEFAGEHLLYCTGSHFGKIDRAGNNIFEISMKHDIWQQQQWREFYFLVMKKYPEKNQLYCLAQQEGKLDFFIYRLSV